MTHDPKAPMVPTTATDRRQLSDLSDLTGFNPHWRSTTNAVLENLAYGSVRHRVALAPDGKPLYDFPHIIEPGGAAVLPYTRGGLVALLRIDRPALLKRIPEGAYPDFLVPSDYGRFVWEAPRGYRNQGEKTTETALRECIEETRLEACNLEYVGNVSANSALLATPIDLYIGMVEANASTFGDATEGIRQVKLFSLAEIREQIKSGDLICAITLALLFAATIRGHLV